MSEKIIKICAFELGKVDKTVTSGGDLILPQMIRHLNLRYDFSILIILPKISKENWNFVNSKNTKLKFLPKNIFDQTQNPIFIFLAYVVRLFQATKIACAEKEYPILYSSTNVFPDVVSCFLCKLIDPKRNWVARIHHLIPYPWQRKGNIFVNFFSFILDRISLRLIKAQANEVIVLNKSLKLELKRQGFKNIYILGAGTDVPKSSEKSSKKVFDGLFIGRIHPTKGVFDLPIIWKEVVSKIPKSRLAIVGNGPIFFVEQLKKQISNYHLEKNISLLGYLSEEKKQSVLKKSKIFLFTDHEAGWGLAIAEAMAFGLPVVGYANEIFGDVFKRGFMKVAKGDTKDMATKVCLLLKNDILLEKLVKETRTQAELLDWKFVSNKFIDLLKKINP